MQELKSQWTRRAAVILLAGITLGVSAIPSAAATDVCAPAVNPAVVACAGDENIGDGTCESFNRSSTRAYVRVASVSASAGGSEYCYPGGSGHGIGAEACVVVVCGGPGWYEDDFGCYLWIVECGPVGPPPNPGWGNVLP